MTGSPRHGCYCMVRIQVTLVDGRDGIRVTREEKWRRVGERGDRESDTGEGRGVNRGNMDPLVSPYGTEKKLTDLLPSVHTPQ